MKLEELAELRIGLPLKRYEDAGGPAYRLLSAKHIDAYGNVTGNETFHGVKVLPGFLTRYNDIVIKIAAPNQAIRITRERDCGLLVPSYFAIIRCADPERCLPQYLTAYLNSDLFQTMAGRERTCTTVRSLKLSTLQTLDLPLPEPARQRELAEFAELALNEQRQMEQLLACKRQYHRALLARQLEACRGRG